MRDLDVLHSTTEFVLKGATGLAGENEEFAQIVYKL
jgi:hypothetical protein